MRRIEDRIELSTSVAMPCPPTRVSPDRMKPRTEVPLSSSSSRSNSSVR